jgi:DNA-binding CsgD family transcriptional regulator
MLHPITPREREAVRLLAKGLTDQEIAQRMGVTTGTVKVWMASARRKTGCRNRVALALWAKSQEEREELSGGPEGNG